MSLSDAYAYLTSCTLAQPQWLWGLLILPFLALWRGGRGKLPAVAYSGLHLLKDLAPKGRGFMGLFTAIFPWFTLALGLLALARPQHIRTHDNVKASGIEIILAIDVSLSMSIEDFFMEGETVNRLTVAKKVCRDFIKGRLSDRIGIVAFAGRPYVPSPLTLDHEWLLETLRERVEIGRVEDGTAIGSAIGASARRLEGRDAKSQIIVLLTDGSNNSGNLTPIDAAKLAQTLGIKVYTVAIGTDGKHRIPLPDRSGRYLPGVRQEFDVESMKKIAEMTGGLYFRAQDTTGLEKVFSQIDTMEKTEINRQTLVEVDELFPWLVGATLAVGALGVMARQTLWRQAPV